MLKAQFFKTPAGNEPARDFIKGFDKVDREVIGTDLKTAQIGWPIGMPVCRQLGDGIHEVRTSLSSKREVRILFFVHDGIIIIVHGILKKTQKTPQADIDLALARKGEFERAAKVATKPKVK